MGTKHECITVGSPTQLKAYIEYAAFEDGWYIELKSLEVGLQGRQHIDILDMLEPKPLQLIVNEIHNWLNSYATN